MPKGLLQFYQLCSLSKPPFDHLENEDIITADLLTTRCYALGYPCLLADPVLGNLKAGTGLFLILRQILPLCG